MAIEDKFDHIKQLLHIGGKQKGYLLYDDNGEAAPPESPTALDDVEDLLTTFGGGGMEVIEGGTKLGEDKLDFDKKLDEAGEELELDLTPGSLDKTNDPVRMYLREMGTVPLLTREGEVEIAKRIERGQNNVLKAMSRCPIVIREVQKLGEELKSGARSIKGVVVFNDDELTDERIQERLKEIVGTVDASKIARLRAQKHPWRTIAAEMRFPQPAPSGGRLIGSNDLAELGINGRRQQVTAPSREASHYQRPFYQRRIIQLLVGNGR